MVQVRLHLSTVSRLLEAPKAPSSAFAVTAAIDYIREASWRSMDQPYDLASFATLMKDIALVTRFSSAKPHGTGQSWQIAVSTHFAIGGCRTSHQRLPSCSANRTSTAFYDRVRLIRYAKTEYERMRDSCLNRLA